jgi:putative nucleotidyltransferase with HDIG domain
LLVFAAALYGLLLVGNPPLGVQAGKPAPRSFAARAAFTDAAGDPVGAGQAVLSIGKTVGETDLKNLALERDAYRASKHGRRVLAQRLGALMAVLLVFIAAAGTYAQRFRPDMLRAGPSTLSFALLTLAIVAASRYCVVAGVSPLWVPVPFAVIVVCLVYDQRVGLAVALFHPLLVMLACPGAEAELPALVVGGVTAALLSRQVRTRSTLIMVGLLTGSVQFCAAWGLLALAGLRGAVVPSEQWGLLLRSLPAMANGVLSGFVASGLLPAIERLFDVTTDVRLLEWSDPNQPLLQKLLLEAPGTYHHSMIVGSLSADAAETIGANPLLARVSAYFHDVGKLRKPEYFAENLPVGARNPHDDLSPSMSSLILTAHPKDGAEMAEEFGVPRVVREIILQSHGASVLKYFWGKAQGGEGTQQGLEEHDFRYRLPKPASKEAAVVMLCDAVESAARSLDSPSVGQLRNLVRDIVLDRLHDGQLDDSGLTITDLKKLQECLVHGLTAVFHSRISYPGQEENSKEGTSQDGDSAA